MKRRHLILLLILVLFAGYAVWQFTSAVTPYVSIAQAQSAKSTVQVKGLLDLGARNPHMENGFFVFGLQDEEGSSFEVRYKGSEPDNFAQAYHIVAIGKYQDGAFYADKLLIKCPSKYEQKGRAL